MKKTLHIFFFLVNATAYCQEYHTVPEAKIGNSIPYSRLFNVNKLPKVTTGEANQWRTPYVTRTQLQELANQIIPQDTAAGMLSSEFLDKTSLLLKRTTAGQTFMTYTVFTQVCACELASGQYILVERQFDEGSSAEKNLQKFYRSLETVDEERKLVLMKYAPLPNRRERFLDSMYTSLLAKQSVSAKPQAKK